MGGPPKQQALHQKAEQSQASASPFSCPSDGDGPRLQALWGRDSRPPCSLAKEWPESSVGPWSPGQQQAMLCPCGLSTVPLVIRGDINVLPVGLLRGDAPPVDMVGTLLLLLRLGPFLLQLLPFVFCPPILEPHLHLGREGGRGIGKKASKMASTLQLSWKSDGELRPGRQGSPPGICHPTGLEACSSDASEEGAGERTELDIRAVSPNKGGRYGCSASWTRPRRA